MRSEMRAGQLVFVDEFPVTWELCPRRLETGRTPLNFWRFEVKASREAGFDTDDELALARYPWSLRFVASARFKSAFRGGNDLRPTFQSLVALEAWWYEPFENGRLLTAAVIPPADSPRSDFAPDGPSDWDWLFGVTKNYKACVAHLVERAAESRRGDGRGSGGRLLDIAARQALAGPPDLPDKWAGRPVIELLADILAESSGPAGEGR
jgi:hypothetical protein